MAKTGSKHISSSTRPRKKNQNSKSSDAYDEYDSPWKEVIEHLFPQLMHFFFPTIASVIDWGRPVEFLDKELQRIAPRSKSGRQTVDKLVKIWRIDGSETWLLIHIEVQSQKDNDFPLRMYIYHYRIFDKYKQRAVSVAILGDDDPHWRPAQYEDQLLGCEVSMKFPTAKLLDYEAKWDELEQSLNPFAIVVMAHLKAVATHGKSQDRLQWKKTIIRNMYDRGHSEQEILNLFRFIDWILKLPEELEKEIQVVVDEYEEAKQMRYVTSIERLAIQRGLEQGLEQGLERGLEQGLEQGLEKGLEQGRRQAKRETILQILQFRFQPDSPTIATIAESLKLVNEESTLQKLINGALETPSPTEFISRLLGK